MFFSARKGRCIELFIDNESLLLQASKKGDGNKTGSAMISCVSQLNHFVKWLSKDEDNLMFFGYKFLRIYDRIDRDKMEEICVETVLENGTTMRKEIAKYFESCIREDFMDDRFIDLMSDYVYDVSQYNLEENSEIDIKICESDVHVYTVLSLFSKIIYILYFKISEFKYNIITKDLLIEMARKVDTRCHMLFPKDSFVLTHYDFIDRIFIFVQHKVNQKAHENNIMLNKFTHLGLSEESLVSKIIGQILVSSKSFSVRRYDNDKGGDRDIYNPETDFESFGYKSKIAVAWLNSTIRRTIRYEFFLAPDFISNVISEGSNEDGEGGDDIHDSTKYNIFIEKNDKERSKYMKKMKDEVMIDCDIALNDNEKLEIEKIVEKKMNIRHKLNEFMVSLFLEQRYDNNIIEMLSYREFLKVVYLISKRMMYTVLPLCLKSPLGIKKNGMKLSEDIFQTLTFYCVNDTKTKNILNQIISHTYIYYSNKHDCPVHYYVKDDFIDFLKNGCVI